MKLELVFKEGKFSGIIVGDRLIEDGEVAKCIKKTVVDRGYIGYEEVLLLSLEKAREEISELKGQIRIEIENNMGWMCEIEKEKKQMRELEGILAKLNAMLIVKYGNFFNIDEKIPSWNWVIYKLDILLSSFEARDKETKGLQVSLEKVKDLISDAKALAYNLTPNRTEDDVKEDLCEQIQLLSDMLKERAEERVIELQELVPKLGMEAEKEKERTVIWQKEAEAQRERVKELEEIIAIQNNTITNSETRINEAEFLRDGMQTKVNELSVENEKLKDTLASIKASPSELRVSSPYVQEIVKNLYEAESRLEKLVEEVKKHKKINVNFGHTPGTMDYELYKVLGEVKGEKRK